MITRAKEKNLGRRDFKPSYKRFKEYFSRGKGEKTNGASGVLPALVLEKQLSLIWVRVPAFIGWGLAIREGC